MGGDGGKGNTLKTTLSFPCLRPLVCPSISSETTPTRVPLLCWCGGGSGGDAGGVGWGFVNVGVGISVLVCLLVWHLLGETAGLESKPNSAPLPRGS